MWIIPTHRARDTGLWPPFPQQESPSCPSPFLVTFSLLLFLLYWFIHIGHSVTPSVTNRPTLKWKKPLSTFIYYLIWYYTLRFNSAHPSTQSSSSSVQGQPAQTGDGYNWTRMRAIMRSWWYFCCNYPSPTFDAETSSLQLILPRCLFFIPGPDDAIQYK